MNQRKLAQGGMLVGVVILVVTIMFPYFSVMVHKATSQPPTDACPHIAGNQPTGTDCSKKTPKETCDDTNVSQRFLAYDPRTKPNNFAPGVNGRTVDTVQARLHRSRCADAAIFVRHLRFNHMAGVTDQNWRSKVRYYQHHHQAWATEINRLEKREAKAKASIVYTNTAYWTEWFKTGDNAKVIPALRQGVVSARHSAALKLDYGHGKVVLYRLQCGFQPMRLHRLPGVPLIHQPAPHGHTHHATPPSHGGCTHNCSTPPPATHSCPCVTPAQVTQPVPSPAPGSPGVPTHEPSPQPSNPSATTGNSGGYDPGTGGAPGGSTSDPGGTSTGNPTPSTPPECDPSLGCGGEPSGTPPPPS